MNKLLPNPAKGSYKIFLIGALLLFFFAGLKAQTVTTPTVTAVTTTTATLGGNVTAGTLTHRGTRWHTSSPVGTNNELEEASVTAGVFTQGRTGLPAGTLIFFTAYARDGGTTSGVTSESSFFTEPTQLTGGQFTATATGETSILLNFPSADSWEGTGATGGYVIFRKSGSAPSLGALADGAIPPADAVGDKITTITDGTATSFNNNTGLAAETDYYYTIIPFVWDGATAATYNYNTTTPQTVNDFTFSTEPASHPASFTATAVSSSEIDLVASAGSSGDGYIILRRADGSDPTTTGVVDGVAPGSLSLPAGTTLAGTTTTTTFNNNTGLSPASRYRYLILPYNANGTTDAGTYNYKIDGSPAAAQNDWTFATEPSGHATGSITATPVSATQINLSFNSVTTSGITNATGYIVLVKSSAIVAGDLATLNDGGVPTGFALFEAEISSTGTGTYNDTGLTPNTTYHYAIIPYNRITDDQTYNFLTTSGFITGSATTNNITATFTPIPAGTLPVPLSSVYGAGTTSQVIAGFSVTSDGTQQIDNLVFQYTGLTGNPNEQWTDEHLYRSTTAGTIGTLMASDNSPDGNFNWSVDVTVPNRTINSTPVYYYLVVDLRDDLTTSTAGVTVALSQANVTVSPGATTPNTFSLSRSVSFTTSQLSDIIVNGGTTDDIPYISSRSGTMSDNGSNSVSIATLQIRDGGASGDPDNRSTRLTNLTIQLTNHTMVRKIALYDGGNELAGSEKTVTAATVNWDLSSTPLDAADDNINNFTVRITFLNTVTDNQAIHVTVTDADFDTGSTFSKFAAADAGGATTTGIAAPANQIEVGPNNLSLSFTGNPPATPLNTNFSLTVQAKDAQNNIDLDYAGQIELTATGGPGTLTANSPPPTLTPFLVAGAFTWNNLRISLSGGYTLTASDGNFLDDLGDATGSVTINSSASSVTQSTDPVLCYGNASSGEVLSNIVITETDPAGISGSNGSYTFSLALPSGFVFDQSVTAGLGVSGGSDLSAPSIYSYPGANIVQFSFTLNGTANTNTITIGGLKVYYLHPGIDAPPPTGVLNITRLGGTATIAGVAPGAVLGSISATQQNPAVTFTVAQAIVTDPPVDPNLTTFNVSGAAVKLVSSVPSGSVFSGSGVTFSNPDYRFNPNTLTAGLYPITVTQTAGGGCQSVFSKTFEVIVSGMAGLLPSYCTNDNPSPPMTVSQAYIDQSVGLGWTFDHFVYFDWNIGGGTWAPITSPSNDVFNPALPQYQASYQVFRSYGYPGLAVSYAVCNGTLAYPCNGTSSRIAPYQWVDLKTAPSVNFTLPSDIYAYCKDNSAVTLTGSPANGNNDLEDKFTASGGQTASISSSLVPPVTGNRVWLFSPAAVTGVDTATSVTFNITYQYKEPSTGCFNTISKPVTVHPRPSQVPSGNITKSPVGPPARTTIQLCEGYSGSYSFNGTYPGYTYKWYENAVSPGNLKGTGPTFNPSVNTAIVASNSFVVTRERNGCESSPTPLALSVNIIAAPVAPSPNFSNAIRQYCVGTPITTSHLEVPGTNVRWYNSVGGLVYSGSTPIPSDLGLSTAAANVYSFNVTQTEALNNCQGSSTPVTVTVKALPIVQITADAPSDANKICTTGGTVTFSAFDQADLNNPAINGNWSGTGLAGTLNPFPTFGKVALDPFTLASGGYTLNYNYTNSAGCASQGSIPITILPKITPSVTVGSVCDGSPAVINNTSVISAGTSTIDFAEWTFGDGAIVAAGAYNSNIDPVTYVNSSGTYQSPQHIYPNTGTFQLSGILTSSDGCKYQLPATVPVTVSPLPVANFTSTNVCVNSVTSFVATTSIPVQTYNWDFALNDVLAPNSATSTIGVPSTTHTYSNTGKDLVRLIVTTSANCQATVIKPIYMVPTYTQITPDDSYAQNFTVNDGWIAGGINSSWELGVPSAAPAPITGNAWDTKLSGPNNPNENSWVMSGCFDFTSSTKPVISLDIWSDVPNGVDGAVLQYNITGNVENVLNSPDPDGDWVTVGEVGSGINWYNENGISNSPGNQTTVSTGWTGKYAQWRKAIYKLDEVTGMQKVVFRIAFASSQPRGEGFTFDNVFVGERSRVVLLENFTNSFSSPTVSAPTAHNAYYRNFGNVLTGELVKVQYHTAFPGADPINNMNQQMNNARAAFYGITEVPTARLDGDFRNGNIINGWLDDINDDRVLTPSAIRLGISAVKVGSVVKINTTIENTTSQALSLEGAHLFTVIVQKSITDPTLLSTSGNAEFVYVAKQMLPNPAGLKLEGSLAPGATYTGLSELTWENPNGDAIVVFVQSIDGNNKNVYQALYLDNPPLPDVILSTEDPAYAERINLFPNPANSEINIQLPMAVTKATSMRVIDTYGRTVVENSFAPGETKKVINTREMLDGMYILQITTPEGKSATRKVMVIHR